MRYGLIQSLFDDTQYLLGVLPQDVQCIDGDWTNYLPKYEPQAEGYETWGCTVWGTQNCIETLYRRLYNIEPNYSERFTYLRAGLKEPGGDPHKVAECIRKDGLVDAFILPVPATYEEFMDSSPIDGSMLAKGQNWLVQHDFKHEWVWKGQKPLEERLKLMRRALQYSPLGVSVSAWYNEYRDEGQPNNHWCMLFKIDTHLHIFDSYDHSIKLLPLDHNIEMCKRFYVAKKKQRSWLCSFFA